MAAKHGHLEIVRLLLDRAADVRKTTIYGETALDLASRKFLPEIVRLLEEAQKSLTSLIQKLEVGTGVGSQSTVAVDIYVFCDSNTFWVFSHPCH